MTQRLRPTIQLALARESADWQKRRGNMRKLSMAKCRISLMSVGGLIAALCVSAEPAQAQSPYDVLGAVAGAAAVAASAPYLYGGRQYCWYDDAWSGPGWYWCGYAYRTGYGWGGGNGWNGWGRGGRGGVPHGGPRGGGHGGGGHGGNGHPGKHAPHH